MARPHRGTSADIKQIENAPIIDDLLNNSRAFSFFQAVRLLRHLVKGAGADGAKAIRDMIRVRPELSLAFPSADIAGIERTEGDPGDYFLITATFLGLYGSTSPLPTFYTEDLIDEYSQDESVSRDFIDILNQRLYDLLYQGWLKYRNFLQASEENNSEHLERLYCLIGLGSEALRQSQGQGDIAHTLLRYMGLFTQFPRSAAGLATILGDALKGIPLKIEQCVLRKAKIPEPQQFRVGLSGSRLGTDSYLGDEIEDRMGKFRIQVGPLDQAGFLQFTPGNKNYELLKTLTQVYCVEPLAYELELILAARQAETVCLGDSVRSVLGVTTWVFSQQHLGEVRTRFTVNRN